MRVLLLPGKNTPFKRYKPYFPALELLANDDAPDVILCHSAGIEGALAHPSGAPIVAMDPSVLPENAPRVKATFVRRGREIPNGAQNVIVYEEQTHWPFMIRHVRNQIVAACLAAGCERFE